IIGDLRMHVPVAALLPYAERAAAALLEYAFRFTPGQRLGPREHALGKVPETMGADTAGDGYLAASGKDVEHEPQRATPPPRVAFGSGRDVLLQIPREQRTVVLEFAQQVAAEACVLAQEVAHPLVAFEAAA